MLFGRRVAPTIVERVTTWLWPRRHWRRSLRYMMLRLERLNATPHAVGLGLGIGVFASFQPILGFQMLFAGIVAWFLRGTIAAALMGTLIGTPVTWPLMWLASYEVGSFLTGESLDVSVGMLWNVITGPGATASPGAGAALGASVLFWKILKPLAIGAVPVGLLFGFIFYAMVQYAARLRPR
jgi:uncharacterized protein